jgi:hypothetical protein
MMKRVIFRAASPTMTGRIRGRFPLHVTGRSGSDAAVSPGRPPGRLALAISLVPFRIGARYRRMVDPAIDLAVWRWRRVFARSPLLDRDIFFASVD